MSTVARAIRNLGALSAAQILVRVFGLVVTAAIARYLSKASFGEYSLCLSFSAMFGVLAGMGIRQIVLREIAAQPASGSRYLSTAIFMAVPQSLITILVVFASATLMGYEGAKLQGIMIMAVTVSLISYESLFYSIFEAQERMHYEALTILLRQSLWIALALLVVRLRANYLMLLWAMLLVAAINVIVSGTLVHRHFYRISFLFDGVLARKLWKAGVPLAAAAVLVDIYLRVDVLMLDKILGSVAVGLYSAGMRILRSLQFISSSFFIVIYPIFSRLSNEGKDTKLEEAYSQSLRFISIFLVPMAAGLSALATPIITLIFGHDYAEGALAFSILVWLLPAQGLSVVMGRLLVAMHLQRVVFWVSVVTVVANIAMNLLLIPVIGIVGAGVASVASGVLVVLLNWYFLGMRIRRLNLLTLLWKTYLSAGLMCWLVWELQNSLTLWQLVLLGMATYPAFMFVLGGIQQQDKVILGQLFQNFFKKGKGL